MTKFRKKYFLYKKSADLNGAFFSRLALLTRLVHSLNQIIQTNRGRSPVLACIGI